MTSLVMTVIDGYNDLLENKSDQRVKGWFMMSSPFPTIIIIALYIFFVTKAGQKIMANQKPFGLRKTLLAYNFIQVLVSIYLFYEGGMSGWFGNYSVVCEPIDYSDAPHALRILRASYFYYLSKISELADTIFFVLRKKNNQISGLHVFHHSIMPFFTWFGVKYAAGGHSTFFGMLNTFVHIWMYLYYFLAALGPEIQPYLWWKKHLTTLQIVQFVLVFIHEAQLLFIECDHPKILTILAGIHSLIFLWLFTNFYRKAYSKDSKTSSPFDVKTLEVDPDREGIKQSDLWATNYEHLVKKRQTQAKKAETSLYADQCNMATGYISDEGLRNRVFLDKNGPANE